jgi:hypothetical protein
MGGRGGVEKRGSEEADWKGWDIFAGKVTSLSMMQRKRLVVVAAATFVSGGKISRSRIAVKLSYRLLVRVAIYHGQRWRPAILFNDSF